MLNADCDREFAEQITSEHRIIESKGGRDVEHWVKKTSAKQNHWWDCAVYAFAVADLAHMRMLQEEAPEQLTVQADEQSETYIPAPNFTL